MTGDARVIEPAGQRRERQVHLSAGHRRAEAVVQARCVIDTLPFIDQDPYFA